MYGIRKKSRGRLRRERARAEKSASQRSLMGQFRLSSALVSALFSPLSLSASSSRTPSTLTFVRQTLIEKTHTYTNTLHKYKYEYEYEFEFEFEFGFELSSNWLKCSSNRKSVEKCRK